jgi:hypothetical protein
MKRRQVMRLMEMAMFIPCPITVCLESLRSIIKIQTLYVIGWAMKSCRCQKDVKRTVAIRPEDQIKINLRRKGRVLAGSMLTRISRGLNLTVVPAILINLVRKVLALRWAKAKVICNIWAKSWLGQFLE